VRQHRLSRIAFGPAHKRQERSGSESTVQGGTAKVVATDPVLLSYLGLDGMPRRTRLTFEGSGNEAPVWSADGTEIIYAARDTPTGRALIYRRRADGNGPRQLVARLSGDADITVATAIDEVLHVAVLRDFEGRDVDVVLDVIDWLCRTQGDRIPIPRGPTSETFITPTLLNALADTRFKIVSGYRGGPDVDLAVERGEADGRMASWTLLKTQRAQWLRDKFVVIPFQAGVTSHPELADIPLIGTLAKTEEGRRIFEFQNSDAGIGWSLVAPPNVPAERVAVLRRAFDAMIADPVFLADAGKRGLEITPASGKELEGVVNRTIATPAEALVTLKKLIGSQ